MNPVKRTVVITGAGSGIGRACVSRVLQAGWRIFASVRKPEDGARLQSECGADVTPLIMDVTDRSSVSAAAQQVARQVGLYGLNGLVNVAGVGVIRPMEYATPRDLQEIFDINAFGQIAVTQAFLPLIRAARGRIVNISSVGAHFAVPFGGLLNASKSAFGIMCDALRMELHPFGVHVSTIEPGAIKTPAVDKTLGHMDTVIANLPEPGRQQYGAMLKSFAPRAYAREMNGSPPEVVAHAVYQALTDPRPKIRYRVGKHSKLLSTLSSLLPETLFQSLLLRITGLPTKFGFIATKSSPM
jgi:NAD(P)-dependent dehydrogenase (short-subunit alcohol dehydrogenase family)